MDLALNNLQWLICHKTKPSQIKRKVSKRRDRKLKAICLENRNYKKTNVKQMGRNMGQC